MKIILAKDFGDGRYKLDDCYLWIDEKGNAWGADNHSMQQALDKSKTLINCVDCLDCNNCEGNSGVNK